MKVPFFPIQRFCVHPLVLTAALSFAVTAYAQQDTQQVEDRVNGILSQMTLDEKLDYISGEPLPTNFADLMGVFDIKPIPRLGVPKIIGNDGTIGITAQGLPAGTRYPAGPLLASTWNADRAMEEGIAQGREARARGIHEILGPGVDFYRTSFGGRSPEYMTGEDPFLGAVLVAAEVNGMQSQQVMATTKHYTCNDQEINRGPTNDFDPTTLPTMNVQVDARTLREIYLPPYESAVKLGHTAAIMGAFNKVNGEFCCQSPFLISNVLKQDWGWLGFIETDFAAEHDGVQAALAGLDIDMPGGSFARMTSATLLPHIPPGGQAPLIPLANIDDKVRRILRQIVSFGFLDRPQKDTSIPINDPRSKTTAIDVSREGIVLLKNDPQILPLDKNATPRIAVIGANAQGEPPTAGGSAEVLASSDFISEIDGIKAQTGATVDPIPECVPNPATAAWQTGTGAAGLIGQYFNSSDLSGSPVATRVDTELNFVAFNANNVPVSNPSSFSGIWTGKVQPTITGDQVFKVSSGGNVRLFVNNQLIIDDTSPVATPNTPISAAPPIIPVSGKIYLQAGVVYDVRLEARNLGGGGTFFANLFRAGGLQVSWASLQPPSTLAGYNAVILAVGANDQYESEGRDRSFGLPEQQDTLIQNVARVNPRTIVVLHGGGGFDVQSWIDRVPALLHAWFPGQYGGQSLAEILFGTINPSGKLPITMEKHAPDNPAFAGFPTDPNASTINYSEGLFVGYRGYEKNHIQPQYPFGYGLSYTTFAYSDLDVDPIVLKQEDQNEHGLTKADWKEGQGDNDLVRVSFTVTNTGKRAGAEIAELYVAPVNPPVVRPIKELKGFTKVYLAPGESKQVTIALDRRSLAYYDVSAHAWDVARGVYKILVGSSSQDIRLHGVVVNLFPSSLSVLESKPVPVQNAD
jgi:beta-glucosidase